MGGGRLGFTTFMLQNVPRGQIPLDRSADPVTCSGEETDADQPVMYQFEHQVYSLASCKMASSTNCLLL